MALAHVKEKARILIILANLVFYGGQYAAMIYVTLNVRWSGYPAQRDVMTIWKEMGLSIFVSVLLYTLSLRSYVQNIIAYTLYIISIVVFNFIQIIKIMYHADWYKLNPPMTAFVVALICSGLGIILFHAGKQHKLLPK